MRLSCGEQIGPESLGGTHKSGELNGPGPSEVISEELLGGSPLPITKAAQNVAGSGQFLIVSLFSLLW